MSGIWRRIFFLAAAIVFASLLIPTAELLVLGEIEPWIAWMLIYLGVIGGFIGGWLAAEPGNKAPSIQHPENRPESSTFRRFKALWQK